MTTRDTARGTLTIGQFARRSGLSYKALRLYDLSGLLRPAEVDPANGYRRYTPHQLERARLISLLRQLNMPLATVAELLAGTGAEMLRRLDGWWAEQEASMRARRDAYDYLRERLTRTGEPPPACYQVGVREVAEAKVAAIRCDVDQASLVPTLLRGQEEIERYLRAAGAVPACERWWVYHGLVTPDSEAPVEVCVPFTGTVDPAGPITIRIEPAHTEAFCTITKDQCGYPRIMAAYEAVEEWVRDTGALSVGPSREIYFANVDEIAGDDPFAHIAQPIEGNQR